MHYTPRIVFARTRLTITSGPLMPCLEIVCMDSFANVSLHQILVFSHFKGTTNLHVSSII